MNENIKEFFEGCCPNIKSPLSLLRTSDNESVILGRTKREYEKYKEDRTLFIGKICEKAEDYFGLKVLVDAIHPHKIFICGKTGSGKSYTLGVIAEELANLNLNIGVVIIDPMGIFWSMKYPSKQTELLEKWKLEPKGFDNIKVFVPIGFYNKVPPETRDDFFAIRPNELTAEDWCSTFGIDIYESPQGALLIEIINRLKQGYFAIKEGRQEYVPPKENYTIDDMIKCINQCKELAKKYRSDTIRALIMHLQAAKNWGIFSTKATPIEKLSVPNQISIIDVSFLPDYLRALIVGIIARKILEKRTEYARYIRAAEIKEQEIPTSGIPVTWLIIDEAHVLAPSKGKTAATEPLVEYAKRGRMPGCALVLATQQPSATDDRILSQVDILITHNLSFTDDIKAFKARAPSYLPPELADPSFIRKLPVGTAIIADQSTTTERAFVIKIRPRISEHAGRIIPPQLTKVDVKSSEKEVEVVQEVRPELKDKTGEIEQALPIPVFSIPESLAIDYLQRILKYRFLDFLTPTKEKGTLKFLNFSIPRTEPTILSILINQLKKENFEIKEVSEIEGTPVVLMQHENANVAITACIAKQITIMVLGILYSFSGILEKVNYAIKTLIG